MRPHVPKRKVSETKPLLDMALPKQIGHDVMSGGRQLVEQSKVAVERIKEGTRKIKRHLGGK